MGLRRHCRNCQAPHACVLSPKRRSFTIEFRRKRAAVDEIELAIDNGDDIIHARRQGRDFATHAGFSTSAVMLVGAAVSELARNILLHARRGSIGLALIDAEGKAGVRITARDEGPGIPEARQTAIASPPSAEHAVLGLCAIKQLFDGFKIVSSTGRGTTVTVEKWMS